MSVATGKVLLAVFCLLGLAGTILPSLPGLLLIWLSAATFAYFTDFIYISSSNLITLTLLAVIGQGIAYLASIVGAKMGGATSRGATGALVGGVIGLIVAGPIGIFLGAFLGAVLLELPQKDLVSSIKAGFGAFLGALGGTLSEFLIGLIMIFLVFKELI